jgi:hypothetical protein
MKMAFAQKAPSPSPDGICLRPQMGWFPGSPATLPAFLGWIGEYFAQAFKTNFVPPF